MQSKLEVNALFDDIEKRVEACDTVAGGLVLFIQETAKFFAACAQEGDAEAVLEGAQRLDATATLMAEAMIENTEVEDDQDGPKVVTFDNEVGGNNTASTVVATHVGVPAQEELDRIDEGLHMQATDGGPNPDYVGPD